MYVESVCFKYISLYINQQNACIIYLLMHWFRPTRSLIQVVSIDMQAECRINDSTIFFVELTTKDGGQFKASIIGRSVNIGETANTFDEHNIIAIKSEGPKVPGFAWGACCMLLPSTRWHRTGVQVLWLQPSV